MDREEAERLVDAYGDAVYRLAYARTGNRADAEDITQETFLRLVRSKPSFHDDSHCRAWLLRVAANCAGDLRRSPWRGRVVPIEEARALPARERGEDAGDILEAVHALPETYRVVIHLYYYEGLSASEIAGVLGTGEGAVYTRLSRARTMLKNRLREDGSYAE